MPSMRRRAGLRRTFISRWLLAEPGQLPEKDQARCENGHAEQLGGREDAPVNMRRRIIAAKRFDECSDEGIKNQVGREDLAVEFFAAVEPGESEVKEQAQTGVIDLRRMNAF